ncbi:MAG TPA: glycosyltransferase [Thermoanaerobaculia bacterium]|jgi:glycosyltransferase involved in cell wall biosynthesis|nr:glycosyltransferase [Thermoanaerobaculia bacterium]
MSFNVIVHTPDVVGDRMAGPGIRAWHLSAELAKHFPTRLIARSEVTSHPERERGTWTGGATDTSLAPHPTKSLAHARDDSGVEIIEHNTPAAREALRDASVLIGQPARGFRKKRREQRIIYDLFDPTVLELRELYGSAPSIRQRIHLAAEWWRLTEALMRADLLICAARKQRELYEKLQSNDAPWIEVPFGVDPSEWRACEKSKDNIVIWGGGVWEWLDPATAVDAVVRVNNEGIRARLLFLGRARPNRNLIDRRRDDRFEELLARGGPHVSANEDWIPYRERLSWLRAGKIAIMLHRRTAEADYSIRTRLFDAIAAGIPVVASAGGFAADLVASESLGIVVPPEDTGAAAEAIRRLLSDDDLHTAAVRNLERIRPRFAWEVVTRPLVSAIMQWQT